MDVVGNASVALRSIVGSASWSVLLEIPHGGVTGSKGHHCARYPMAPALASDWLFSRGVGTRAIYAQCLSAYVDALHHLNRAGIIWRERSQAAPAAVSQPTSSRLIANGTMAASDISPYMALLGYTISPLPVSVEGMLRDSVIVFKRAATPHPPSITNCGGGNYGSALATTKWLPPLQPTDPTLATPPWPVPADHSFDEGLARVVQAVVANETLLDIGASSGQCGSCFEFVLTTAPPCNRESIPRDVCGCVCKRCVCVLTLSLSLSLSLTHTHTLPRSSSLSLFHAVVYTACRYGAFFHRQRLVAAADKPVPSAAVPSGIVSDYLGVDGIPGIEDYLRISQAPPGAVVKHVDICAAQLEPNPREIEGDRGR